MEKEQEQELSRKLAEWAGFDVGYNGYVKRWRWQAPDGEWDTDFTQSLDACFKWLVPRVDGWRVVIFCNDAGGCTSYIDSNGRCRMWEETLSFAKTPALALCLAIEKLIGSGKE